MVAYLLQPHSNKRVTVKGLLDWRNNTPSETSYLSNKEKIDIIWANEEAKRAARANGKHSE